MSCRRSSPLKPCQALEVIGQVGHADLDGGAGDTDGEHDQPHSVLLSCEHMLDLGADFGSPRVGPGDPFRQRLPWLALVDVALEHAPLGWLRFLPTFDNRLMRDSNSS